MTTTPGAVVVTVPYLAHVAAADGDLTDLADLPSLELDKGKVTLAWTPERLHVAALVRDSSLVSTRRLDTTSTDALILEFGDAELFITSTRGNWPIVRRSKGGKLDRILFHRRRGPEGTTAAVRRAEDVGDVSYELSIPWVTLSDALPAGQAAIPFRLTVRDRQNDAVVDSRYEPVRGARVVLELAPPAGPETVVRLSAALTVVAPGGDPGVSVELYRSTAAEVADIALRLDGTTVWSGSLKLEAGRTVHSVQGLKLETGPHQVEVILAGKPAATLDIVAFDRAAVGQKTAQLAGRLQRLPLQSEEARRSSATALYLADEVADILRRGRITSVLAGRCLNQLAALESALAHLDAGRPATAGQKGRLQCAHRSRLDGTLQPYVLFVPEAATAATTAATLSLLVVLPDAGEDQVSPFESGHLQESARRHGFMVLAPYGRSLDGNYTGPSEVDVGEAIDDVVMLQKLDRERVFIAGSRAGGTGALELGLTRPDRFRGIASIDALPDRVAAWTQEWHKEPVSWLTALFESMSAGAVAANGREMAIFVAFHAALPQVKAQNQSLIRGLQDAGAKVQALEVAGTEPDALLWEKILALFEANAAPRPSGHVVFATTRLGHNEAWWARIDQVRVHGLPANLWAERSDGGVFKATVENVLAFTLSAQGIGLGPDESATVSIEGQELVTGVGESRLVQLHQRGDKWAAGAMAPATLPQKLAGAEGPISDAFTKPFVYVYGDVGPDAVAAQRAAREGARRWEQRYSGKVEVKAESALTDADEAGRNLVLVGTPASSSRLRDLLSGFPIRVTTASVEVGASRYPGRTVALQFVAPNKAKPGRCIVAVTGTSADALSLLAGHDWRKPDYLIVDQSYLEEAPQSALGGGFFDRNWKP